MISVSEKRWVWLLIFLLLTFTTVPYLLGFALQGADLRFSGFFLGVEDGNSYIAKMLIGASGAWLFKTPYTAYPQNGFLAFIPYLLLGKLAVPPAQHEQLVALFQLFRWGGGMAAVWATYRFVSFFIEPIWLRKFGTILVTAGGGLGWLSVLGMDKLWSTGLPLEFYSPETFGFLSILGLPHLAMGRALLLWGLVAYLELGKVEKPGKWQSLWPGILWFILGFMQPLTIASGWAILAAHLGITGLSGKISEKRSNLYDWQTWRRLLRSALTMVMISSPWVAYTFISFTSDPYLREWGRQNIILSPPPQDYLLAFMLILPFATLGIRSFMNRIDFQKWMLLAWVVIFPLLAYAPYNLQRRLPEGIWVALVVLGLFGLGSVRSRRWRIISNVYLVSGLLPAALILAGSFLTTVQTSKPVFLPTVEVETIQAAGANSPGASVILADFETSNAIPAWIPAITLIGHGPESMHLSEIQPIVEDFFNNNLAVDEQEKFLSSFNVDLILLTPRQENFDRNGGLYSGLFKEIYHQGSYRILQVMK